MESAQEFGSSLISSELLYVFRCDWAILTENNEPFVVWTL